MFRRSASPAGASKPEDAADSSSVGASAASNPQEPLSFFSSADKAPDMNTKPSFPMPGAAPIPAPVSATTSVTSSISAPSVSSPMPSMGYSMPTASRVEATPVRRMDPLPSPTRQAAPVAQATETRKLIVGRDISLAGEIASCDVLVVEGTVEAKLRDGRNIVIADNGLFKGAVEIDDADIAGRFEGDLVVRGRLRIRATGRVVGSVQYGELEIEAGGQVSGQLQVLGTVPSTES